MEAFPLATDCSLLQGFPSNLILEQRHHEGDGKGRSKGTTIYFSGADKQ
jgi:hypothetical protein